MNQDIYPNDFSSTRFDNWKCFLVTNLLYSLSSVMDCHEVLNKKNEKSMHMPSTLSTRNTLTD